MVVTDSRPSLTAALAAFGLTGATVTRPNAAAIIGVTVMWVSPSVGVGPVGMDLQAVSSRRVMVLPRSTVPTLPKGTVVVAPEYDGGALRVWVVDEFAQIEYDHWRAVVVPSGFA